MSRWVLSRTDKTAEAEFRPGGAPGLDEASRDAHRPHRRRSARRRRQRSNGSSAFGERTRRGLRHYDDRVALRRIVVPERAARRDGSSDRSPRASRERIPRSPSRSSGRRNPAAPRAVPARSSARGASAPHVSAATPASALSAPRASPADPGAAGEPPRLDRRPRRDRDRERHRMIDGEGDVEVADRAHGS